MYLYYGFPAHITGKCTVFFIGILCTPHGKKSSRCKSPEGAGEPRLSACILCGARTFRIGSMHPQAISRSALFSVHVSGSFKKSVYFPVRETEFYRLLESYKCTTFGWGLKGVSKTEVYILIH